MADILFSDKRFIDLCRPYTSADDPVIIDAMRRGAKKVCRVQGLFRVVFAQDADDARIFAASHRGFGFGKLVKFTETEEPFRQIVIDGAPKYDFDGTGSAEDPERTTITVEWFGAEGGGAGMKAQAVVALQLRETATGVPELVFDQYCDLFRAAAMTDLMEFLNPDNTVQRDWMAEYRRESNGAQRRVNPPPSYGARPTSFLRPAGGGVREGGGGWWRRG